MLEWCLAKARSSSSTSHKVIADVYRSIFQKLIFLDPHSIEYFFADNISSYLVLNCDFNVVAPFR
jgi:hypothetical protein